MSSFWSDASPITKGVIVIGALGLIYLGVAKLAGFPPFLNTEVAPVRGLTPQ